MKRVIKKFKEKKGDKRMDKKYKKGEVFLTNTELNFDGEIIPANSILQIIETNVDGGGFRVCFEECSSGETMEQIFYAHEIEQISLSDEEVLRFFEDELEVAKSPIQISIISEKVSNYIFKKEPNIKAMFTDYWDKSFQKNESFQSLSVPDKLKEFQNKQVLWELTKSEFLEMLEHCNIRIPKACLEIIYVRNDDTMRLTTKHKAQTKAVSNAYNKLINYVF